MKRTSRLLVLLLASCANDPPPEDTSPPPLGARIFDRVGRAAVNTALIGLTDSRAVKNEQQQDYNEAAVEMWPIFAPEIAKNLAIFDALDADCGNQVLAGGMPTPGRYDTLAGALADDRLYVNTDAGTCAQYLAVELDATQIAPNDDCGGRTPAYDVIDTTYSALAVGGVSGVGDGIDADVAALPDAFPFFAR